LSNPRLQQQSLQNRLRAMPPNPCLVPDELWEAFCSILRAEATRTRGGRPRLPDRRVLGGILFVLRTGIPWEELPPRLGCGSGMTCWRRLRELQQSGEWYCFQNAVERRFGDVYSIDWGRAERRTRTLVKRDWRRGL
jgi:transposase